MGLDTSHGCWHAPYSAFMRFREYIAEAVPDLPPLDQMAGFTRPPDAGFSWGPFEDDPIVTLLYHSDCDGDISPDDAGPLADRLEELRPAIVEAARRNGEHRGYPLTDEQVGNWITGLREAAAANEPVEFG